MLTIAPPPCSRIRGAAALVQINGPVRLTCRMRLQSSSEVSSNGANTAMPALLTSASSRPKRALTDAMAFATAFASETSQCSSSVLSGSAQRSDRAAQQFALDVEQRHRPALGEKPFGGRKPDAARGAGDERDLAVRWQKISVPRAPGAAWRRRSLRAATSSQARCVARAPDGPGLAVARGFRDDLRAALRQLRPQFRSALLSSRARMPKFPLTGRYLRPQAAICARTGSSSMPCSVRE